MNPSPMGNIAARLPILGRERWPARTSWATQPEGPAGIGWSVRHSFRGGRFGATHTTIFATPRGGAATMFYDRLFVLDPSLRPLFKGDMAEQGKKLMAMIGTAVAKLDKLETIVPAVRDLGRRHATYGVLPWHYDTVGAALIWTPRQGLGETFTPPVEAAWTEAYTILATVMKDASVA